jgi:Dioxygenase
MFSTTKSIIFACVLLAFCSLVCVAHPEGEHDEPPPVDLVQANAHVARRCKRSSVCTLTNELVEGPYYVALDLLRWNITYVYCPIYHFYLFTNSIIREGTQTGIPMIIIVNVIDYHTCEPVENAAIDIWHANATGVYSHYEVSGNAGGATTTFLRGKDSHFLLFYLFQNTNLMSRCTNDKFKWCCKHGYSYPWLVHWTCSAHSYQSPRCWLCCELLLYVCFFYSFCFSILISCTDYSPGTIVHTGQMFFNQSFMDSYADVEPYASNTQTRLALADDQW